MKKASPPALRAEGALTTRSRGKTLRLPDAAPAVGADFTRHRLTAVRGDEQLAVGAVLIALARRMGSPPTQATPWRHAPRSRPIPRKTTPQRRPAKACAGSLQNPYRACPLLDVLQKLTECECCIAITYRTTIISGPTRHYDLRQKATVEPGRHRLYCYTIRVDQGERPALCWREPAIYFVRTCE